MQARYGSRIGVTATFAEMREALKGDRFKSIKRALTQDYLLALKKTLTPETIHRALDIGGGTNQSWQELFNAMHTAFGDIGLNIYKAIPNPHEQRKFCGVMNEAFTGMRAFKVGEDDGAEVEGDDKILDNVQMDVTILLQTLVHLYDLKSAEVGGTAVTPGVLKVCLKLDETIWAGEKKMERLTVTVMNRALAGKDQCAPNQWCQVQSEREVWPVAMFEVKKESHATLKQYLSTSQLNKTITAHNNGEILSVAMPDGKVEKFTVEWHAAGDLKTLKCCNGCQTGPAAKCVCIYCMSEREKATVSAGKSFGKASGKGRVWAKGVKASRPPNSFGKAPTRDKQDAQGNYVNDPDWDPVLDIPLSRTHICTMHGENRMVEKLVHLHLCKIWNMPEGGERASRIAAVNQFLGGERAEGGMGMKLRGERFKVSKCDKLSGKYGSTPMKPSFNDVRAREFTAHASRRVPKMGEVSTPPTPPRLGLKTERCPSKELIK